jgi:NADPH:quinone reductase-like Zn-dependent oxidoreductase
MNEWKKERNEWMNEMNEWMNENTINTQMLTNDTNEYNEIKWI